MRTLLALVFFLIGAGSFSFVYAAPSYELTATCDLTTGTMHYVSNGPAVGRYYDVYQGIVGFGELMNGSSAGNSDTYDQVNTCDNLDDSLTPTKLHINSYWFAAVFPATDVSAFRDYFTGVSGSPPNNDYGVALCDTFSCQQLVNITIGTTTALGFLSDVSATSTLEAIADQCAESGNIFSRGICVAVSYLFIPSPQTLNQFTSLASTSAEKFPISWFYGVRTAVSSAQATSSSNMSDISFNLGSLGYGSTTPIGNVLPNISVFSTSTITQFMPTGVWSAIQAFMAAALWVGLMAYIWYSSRNLFHV